MKYEIDITEDSMDMLVTNYLKDLFVNHDPSCSDHYEDKRNHLGVQMGILSVLEFIMIPSEYKEFLMEVFCDEA